MKKEKVFWGLVFVLAAACILISALGMFHAVSWVSIIIGAFLVIIMLKGIRSVSFPEIIFPLAILYLLFSKFFPFAPLEVWPVLGVALFLSIGLSLIFPKKHFFHFHNKQVYSETETTDYSNTIHQSVSFNSSIKYVNSTTFEKGNFECSFGSMKVFFDNTQFLNNSAEVYAEASFGSIIFYIPKDWNVHINVETAFASVEEKGQKINNTQGPVLYLNGEVSFGSIEIIYV